MKSLSIPIAAIVIIFVAIAPLSTSILAAAPGVGVAGLNDNITAIQQQIQQLQQKAAAIKKLNEIKEQQRAAQLLLPIQQLDRQKNCATDQHTPTTYITYLTHFSCGHVTVFGNGTVLRKFTLIADDFGGTGKPIPISTNQEDLVFAGSHQFNKTKTPAGQKYDPVIFHAWTFNGTVPGPTIRVTAGDHVQVTMINAKDSAFAHSWHVHSIHSGPNDGTMTQSGMIFPGENYTYDFVADPPGVYPYHCHMAPVEEHISRGLYGMMIIDPPKPRPAAAEMVMMLNSYSFSYEGVNGSGHLSPTVPATMADIRKNLTQVEENSDEGNGPDNQFYSVNGMPFGYTGPNEVHLKTHTPYRIYLANMVEFDDINSFHIHGTMGNFTESGTITTPKVYTDIVALQQGDRGIFEFSYKFPGIFMFHSHINHFTDLGWIGFFNVTNAPPTTAKPMTK